MEVRVGRGRGRRGRPVANAKLRDEIRNLRARLDVLETGRHHEHTGDTSDEEIPEVEEETTAETPEVRVLNSIFGAGSSSRADVPFYNGSLNPEELIEWISAMNKHFDFAEVKEDNQVRFAVTRLRGHASLWWDGVQEERTLKNKARINSWSRMTAKLRGQRKEELECSMKYGHRMEESKTLLQTQCCKTWLKGLFKMRTLPRFISRVFAVILQKNSRKGAHGQEPMKFFKLGSLMQEHRLPSGITYDFTRPSGIF